MSLGLIGQKVGMTTIFDAQGRAVPVTVVHAGPCVVVQTKNNDNDGYASVQVGYGERKESRVSGGEKGHFKKANLKPARVLKEFRLNDGESFDVGHEFKVDMFAEGQLVDVTGTSIGRGFAGLMKRWNAGRGPMSHGSKFHRHPGSIGAGTTPSRGTKPWMTSSQTGLPPMWQLRCTEGDQPPDTASPSTSISRVPPAP